MIFHLVLLFYMFFNNFLHDLVDLIHFFGVTNVNKIVWKYELLWTHDKQIEWIHYENRKTPRIWTFHFRTSEFRNIFRFTLMKKNDTRYLKFSLLTGRKIRGIVVKEHSKAHMNIQNIRVHRNTMEVSLVTAGPP